MFPKYTLELATKREESMQDALRLALAETRADVRAACANSKTDTYNFKRHIFLRQSFVTVYVCPQGVDGKDKVCVDTHKHYIEGCGWTEHSVFVKMLSTGQDKVEKIPRGPLNSQLRKKQAQRKQPQPKTSQEFRTMMGAPQAECDDDTAIRQPIRGDSKPDVDGKSDLGKCMESMAPDDHQCVARTSIGGRCKSKRVEGYTVCQLHKNRLESPEAQEAWLKTLTKRLQSDEKMWRRIGDQEDEQLEKAMRASLEEDRPRQARLTVLKGRLARRGLALKRVKPDGNCQFDAVLEMVDDLGVDHEKLREMVHDYLAEREEVFGKFLDTGSDGARFRGYKQYLKYIGTPKKWAGHLSLAALANILMRPIIVINDSLADEGSEHTQEPHLIAKECWKTPIVLAHHLEIHYDATMPLPKQPASSFDAVRPCEDCREFGPENCPTHGRDAPSVVVLPVVPPAPSSVPSALGRVLSPPCVPPPASLP